MDITPNKKAGAIPDTRQQGSHINAALKRFMPLFIQYIHPVLHRYKTNRYDLHENQIKVIMAANLLGQVTPTQLSDALILQKGSLTTIIRSLVGQGLLERSNAPDDARKYYLSVTDAGRAFIHEKNILDVQHFGVLFADMPPADVQKVCDGLGTLSDYLEKAGTHD